MPLKTSEEEPNPKLLKEFNFNQKKRGGEKIANFVKPGNPGERFKKVFDEMINKLTLPEEVIKRFDQEELLGNKEQMFSYLNFLKNGKYYLVPSFFKLIEKLKKAKREFVIVFRSFGSDIKNAISEFNE